MGHVPRLPARLRVGFPACISETSVLVPPISKEIELLTSVLLAIWSVAITPAAGPDNAVCTGCRTAMSAPIMPPLDFIMENENLLHYRKDDSKFLM
ncbi:MAG: hypothetical protein Ct9H300mP11_05640 [Chloroflexota bacterium]|nr:MAG: hypothetical protein Ct9H300mP11_05640 [Chloroflexota bacterium]